MVFLIQLACSLAFHFHLLLTLLHQHTFSLIVFLTQFIYRVCAYAFTSFFTSQLTPLPQIWGKFALNHMLSQSLNKVSGDNHSGLGFNY